MPRAKAVTQAGRCSSAPSLHDLEALIDDLAELQRDAKGRADALRDKERVLGIELRRYLADAERVDEYLLLQLQRLDAGAAEGASYRARLHFNRRPAFRWEGDPQHIPLSFRKATYKLDDEACLAAFAAGRMPKSIQASVGNPERI